MRVEKGVRKMLMIVEGVMWRQYRPPHPIAHDVKLTTGTPHGDLMKDDKN